MWERIARLFENIVQDVRLFGWGALAYFLDRVLSRASAGAVRLHKYWIVAQPVRPPATESGRTFGGTFDVRVVTEDDARYEDYPRPEEVIRRRFRQGGQCLAAYRQGTFVGYIWFNMGPYYEDEVRCRFVPCPRAQASWDYDAFVVPRYRLGRAFSSLWSAALESMYAQGARVSYSRISAYNGPSIAAHTRLGSSRVATVYFFRLGRLQWMVGTLPPHTGISVFGTPTLRVGPRRPPSSAAARTLKGG